MRASSRASVLILSVRRKVSRRARRKVIVFGGRLRRGKLRTRVASEPYPTEMQAPFPGSRRSTSAFECREMRKVREGNPSGPPAHDGRMPREGGRDRPEPSSSAAAGCAEAQPGSDSDANESGSKEAPGPVGQGDGRRTLAQPHMTLSEPSGYDFAAYSACFCLALSSQAFVSCSSDSSLPIPQRPALIRRSADRGGRQREQRGRPSRCRRHPPSS